MATSILLYTLVAVVIIQIGYLLSFSSFLFHKTLQQEKKDMLPVSIIVCAKNESENLQKLIPRLLQQAYPTFQLVLINDTSTDNTLEIMQRFQKQDNRIRMVDVENDESFWGNKKYALTLGIKAAKYDHLVFTDADCLPASKNWVALITQQFSDQKTIILGYGAYRKTRSSLLNLLVRYETVLTAIQYFSYAKLGSPYMAVGRNFAYHRKEFFRVKGFINHIQVQSGDDDLFIKDAANSNNTSISIHPNSFTFSYAPSSLSKWFHQKRRHITTAIHYKSKHKILLGLFFLSKVIFWIITPLSFFFLSYTIALPLIASYLLLNYFIIGFSAKKLQEPKVLYFQPFLEIFLVLFQITIFIANSISKPTHWK